MPLPAPASIDPIPRLLKVRSSALRTAAGSVKPLPVFKDISATQTAEGLNNELFSLGYCAAGYVRKVLIDLFLPDAQGPGDLSCAHLIPTQNINHLLTSCFALHPDILLTSPFRGDHVFSRCPGRGLPPGNPEGMVAAPRRMPQGTERRGS